MAELNSKHDSPLVTVGVASYNNARYIIETLDSIASQTYKNYELIINEDGSTDNSLALIRTWIEKHPEINSRLIINDVNQGICKAGNNILSYASGKYVCLIGSDDKYLPDFLITRVQLLETSDDSVGLCYSMTYFIDEQGSRTGKDIRPSNPSGRIYDHIASGFGSFCKPFTNLIKIKCFEKVGYYDETLLYEDWDWFLRVSKEYKIIYFDRIDTEYRNTEGSLGKKLYTEEGIESQFRIIKKNIGYSRLADKYFKTRLLRLAKKSIEYNYHTAPNILRYSIKKFYGVKELGLLIKYSLLKPVYQNRQIEKK